MSQHAAVRKYSRDHRVGLSNKEKADCVDSLYIWVRSDHVEKVCTIHFVKEQIEKHYSTDVANMTKK